MDAPNWPWLPGEVIDLTASTDSPLSANPPPLPFDLGQLEPQPGTESDPMNVDPPHKRRSVGFRRVRTVHDLQPRVDVHPGSRRMGADGIYLSVSKPLTFA